MNEFNHNYLNWKNWTRENFGQLKWSAKYYFYRILKKSKRSFDSDAAVLEIGFGNGKFLAYAKNNFREIYGLEKNLDLVEIAQDKGFKAYNSDHLKEFEDDKFDLIVAFDVLEHIADDHLINFLNEIKRILKPHGCFLSRSPNVDSAFGLILQNGDLTHQSSIGSGKIKNLVKQLQFELVYLGGDIEIVIKKNPISTLKNIIRFFLKIGINFLVSFLFRIDNFCSMNLVFIIKKLN